MSSSPELLKAIAKATINVAERHPSMRWPGAFDEAELQKNAAAARDYLRRPALQSTERGEP